MSDTPNWMNTYGDTVGLPGLLSTGLLGAQAAKGIGRAGLSAIRGIAGAPFAGASAFLYGMGDGRNASTAANAGEKDIYVRGPDGRWMLNPNNPAVSMGNQSPMSPMPASDPWPMQANGMNPANPSLFQQFAPAAPQAAPAAAAPPVAATPGPSSPPGGASPPPGSVGSPLNGSGLPRVFASPDDQKMLAGNPTADQVVDAYQRVGGWPKTQPPPGLYNGPGSSSFGAGDGQPAGGVAGLMDLFKGGTAASNALQRAPNKPFWDIARLMSGGGQSFAPGWFASNAPYNN